MKRSLLLGLLALVPTGCGSVGGLTPGMNLFSIDHRQFEPVDGDGTRPRENPRDQPPGGPANERIRGGII